MPAYKFIAEVFCDDDLIATEKGQEVAEAVWSTGMFARVSSLEGVTIGGIEVRKITK